MIALREEVYMYATITIQMPVTSTGIPVVELDKVLRHIVPDLRHAIDEGITQGQKLIPLNDHLVTNTPRVNASVSWQYRISSEISPLLKI